MHKRQRRIMNLPFTQTYVTGYMGVFQEQADKLCDKWRGIMQQSGTPTSGWEQIDVYRWLGKVTLEVIGLTALDYDFHSLDEDDIALANAFQKMMGAQEATKFQTFSRMIRQRLPFTKIYKTKYFRDIDTALNLMHSDCRKMVATRFDQARNGEVEGKTDLLTLLGKLRTGVVGKG